MKTMRNEYRDLKKENDLIFQRWQSTTATPSRKSSAW